MKNQLGILIFSLFSICLSLPLTVAGQLKKNLGFESGTFKGWTGTAWIFRTTNPVKSTQPVIGIDPYRHFIISDKSASDPNTGNSLKMIPPGYNYSARLGTDAIYPGETVVGGQHQTLSYTMKVDSSNALLIWMFALVLQDPANNHLYDEEPHFRISLVDENGNTITDCTYYDVHSGDAGIKGFQTYTPAGSNEPVVWRDWTAVGANLLPYYGQTITIEFLTAGCTKSRHYGYGYFVLDCLPLYVTVDYCRNSRFATLKGPDGFSSYGWRDGKGVLAGTSQTLKVMDPVEGAKYSCNITSATGCTVTLVSTISRYDPRASFSSRIIDCNTNEVQFENKSIRSNGWSDFLWDFGNGKNSTEANPVYKFETSGLHRVSLIAFNPPSVCSDTLVKDVESFSKSLVGINGYSTYCPGGKTTLKGYGAVNYRWSTGSKSDSIQVGSPGGKFWMIGYSTEGCTDTTGIEVKEEPDWLFTASDNRIICKGDSTGIEAVGAVRYSWNTGQTTPKIFVSKSDSYKVTGANSRGCTKELLFKMTEDELPGLTYELSANVVDTRHNTVTASVKPEPNVTYKWEMGDGTIGTGEKYTHSYVISPDDLMFPVTITAINANNCISTASETIMVDVFVPNVFTPNNDGINDLFMPGYFLTVFDRYGLTLYSGNSGWDGTYKGNRMSRDTYFYVLDYFDIKKELHRKQGFVTLVR